MLRACVAAPTDAMHGLISAFTCDIFLDLFMALLILALCAMRCASAVKAELQITFLLDSAI